MAKEVAAVAPVAAAGREGKVEAKMGVKAEKVAVAVKLEAKMGAVMEMEE